MSPSKVLASFKAGKLSLDGKILKADPRKGLLALMQEEDGMMHLTWSERSREPASSAALKAEDDVVVFPRECILNQIGSSRNYVLKFTAELDRNMFFWMQEPDSASDAGNTSLLNKCLSGDVASGPEPMDSAPAPGPSASPAPGPASAPTHSQGPAPGAAVGTVTGTSGSSNQGLAASLSSALAAAMASGAPPPADAASSLAASLLSALATQRNGRDSLQSLASDPGPSLVQVLRPEFLSPLLSDPEALQRLAEYLPEEHRTSSGLQATLGSHAFRQQLGSLSAALQTGQLNMSQFGLQVNGFSVANFLEAIQQSVDQEKAHQQD